MAESKTDEKPEKKPAPKRTVSAREKPAGVSRPSPVSGGVVGFVTMVTLAAAAGLVILHPKSFAFLTDSAGKILTTLVRGK